MYYLIFFLLSVNTAFAHVSEEAIENKFFSWPPNPDQLHFHIEIIFFLAVIFIFTKEFLKKRKGN